MSIVDKGAPSHLVSYHQGSLPGAFSCYPPAPRQRKCDRTVDQQLELKDTPDWVAQPVREELFEVPDRFG